MRLWLAATCVVGASVVAAQSVPARAPHNVILFVPDGLRALKVDARTAPAMAALRMRGVNFANSHSLFPTFTTANASAMATGHYLGDTGDFSNTIFSAFPLKTAQGTVTPFLESDAVLGEMDEHFAGNFLHETTLLEAARAAGFSTAAIGKLGPTLIFDHRNRTGAPTIVIDDSTGTATGIPLSAEMQAALQGAKIPRQTPTRGDNGRVGTSTTPGTTVANVQQQDYLVNVVTGVLLPMFKARGKPFLLVYWSRDPDGTQHGHGDSLNTLSPGVNGPTSAAAVKNADDNFSKIEIALAKLGLTDSTNIVISADHGVSTISKQSQTSAAAKAQYADVPRGFLPPGFLAIDLAQALQLPLFDPDAQNAPVAAGRFSRRGNGLIGRTADAPDVVVAANGGSDLVYLPGRDKAMAGRVIKALLAQDYTSGLFVDDKLGRFAGTLPLSAIRLAGSAATPRPSIVVGFRTMATSGCPQPALCAVEIADTAYQQGQGMHGSFSRADTMNFQAAAGPDFRAQFIDTEPSSNADIGQTIARLLGLKMARNGKLVGRVLEEALRNGKPVTHSSASLQSDPAPNGLRTVLIYQKVGDVRYFDVAGFPGRTLSLDVK